MTKDPMDDLSPELREALKGMLEQIEKARASASNPPPVETQPVAYFGPNATYKQVLAARLILRLVAAGSLRKILRRCGVEVSRVEAFTLLRSAAFVLQSVMPDHRGVERRLMDQANADVARLFIALTKKVEEHTK